MQSRRTCQKIEQAIKITVEATVPAKRTTKKPWISEETLKLADEKRRLKQLKNISLEYTQQYNNERFMGFKLYKKFLYLYIIINFI
jgi:ribulose bisphosphate carboxylase small subunit